MIDTDVDNSDSYVSRDLSFFAGGFHELSNLIGYAYKINCWLQS